MAVLIVLPLLLAWALLPASAKPGVGKPFGQDQTASAAPDTVRLASLVNAERARRSLPTLSLVPRLSRLAGAQSARMAAARRLSASPGLADAVQPASAWDEQVRCAGSVEQAHRELMQTAGAKRRLLSRSYNAIGVGTSTAGCVWVTELLAKVPDATAAGSGRRPGRPGPTSTTAPTTTRATTTTKPTPKPTAAPGSAAQSPPGNQSTAQKLVSDLLERLNAERRARGLAALDWDDDLARMAAGWSAQMARTRDFSHRDLGAAGGLPGMAKFSALGENIAWVEGYPHMGSQLHQGWMRSEGHRANLLQRGFDSVGIGVVCSGGRAWATQNFGRLDTSSAPSMSSSTPAEEPIVATRADGVRC